MSFLDQLKLKKSSLKSTVTNITYADGTQEQIKLSQNECGHDSSDNHRVKRSIQQMPKTYGFVVDTKPDHIPAIILDDFLFLGSQDAVTLENVQNYHLTDVLSVGIQAPDSDIVYGNGENSTVGHYFIECLDMPSTRLDVIVQQTNQIIEHVHKRNGRILIHCNAGVSRSASVCIAYLMVQSKMNFDAAFALVKSKRECIRPNDGFLKQLKQMDQQFSGLKKTYRIE